MKVLFAFAPPLIWLLYFWERENLRSPAVVLAMGILGGAGAAAVALFTQQFLHDSLNVSFAWLYPLGEFLTPGRNPQYLVTGIIYGGLIEETLKFAVLLMIAVGGRRWVPIVYWPLAGGAIGCGFFMIENAIYHGRAANWHDAALLRNLMPMHILYGMIAACLLALGRLRGGNRALYLASLVVPMLLHALCNLSISMNLPNVGNAAAARIVFSVAIIICLYLSHRLHREVWRDRAEGIAPLRNFKFVAWRKFGWYLLALFSLLLGLYFLLMSGDNIVRVGAPVIFGLLALTYAVLFIRQGRALMQRVAPREPVTAFEEGMRS